MGLFRAVGALVSIVIVAACSSGASGGSGGGRTGTCSSFCSQAEAKGCTTYTTGDCEANCESSLADNPEQCRPYQLGGMLCLLETFGCDFSNLTGVDVVNACPNEIASYGGCTACLPEADDDACDACMKSHCCAERKSTLGDVTAVKYAVCVYECVDSACVTGCNEQYPGMEAKIQAWADCESANCPEC